MRSKSRRALTYANVTRVWDGMGAEMRELMRLKRAIYGSWCDNGCLWYGKRIPAHWVRRYWQSKRGKRVTKAS